MTSDDTVYFKFLPIVDVCLLMSKGVSQFIKIFYQVFVTFLFKKLKKKINYLMLGYHKLKFLTFLKYLCRETEFKVKFFIFFQFNIISTSC